jgi:hypothetical protein
MLFRFSLISSRVKDYFLLLEVVNGKETSAVKNLYTSGSLLRSAGLSIQMAKGNQHDNRK